MGQILQKPSGRAKTMGEIQALLDQQSSENAFQEAKDQEELDVAANVSSSSNQLKQNLKEQSVEQAKKDKEQKKVLTTLPSRAVQTALDVTAEKKDQFVHTYNQVVDFFKSGWETLGNIATPGSIFLPVVILLLFFFVVFPVNGHSRFEWWFMAMTGQAEITGVIVQGPLTEQQTFNYLNTVL